MKSKLLLVFFGLLFFCSSYATLEECYKDGLDESYEKVLETCKPYLKKDARATGLLAEANNQLDNDDKVTLDNALWAVDFYKENDSPTNVEGLKSYVYSLYLVGELYYFGSDHIKVDQKKGFEYIRKAGNLGYALAQNQLGNLYVRSMGVPPTNFAQAYKWYKLAIANGNLDAIKALLVNKKDSFFAQYPYCISQGRTLIGDAYLAGIGGLTESIEKALECYNKAYSVDRISPVEVGLAKAYIALGDKKSASNYAKKAIAEPYAPAFVVMSQLTDDKVKKYTYLSVAISLFKSPAIKFWGQFNEFCLPDLSENGIEDAKKQLGQISLDDSQMQQVKKMTKSLESNWEAQEGVS